MCHLDYFFHDREAILCPSPSSCPHNCEYSQTNKNTKWSSQKYLGAPNYADLLLFGELILYKSAIYQNIFQRDQAFLLNSQTLLVTMCWLTTAFEKMIS